jgi:hypothetical protein
MLRRDLKVEVELEAGPYGSFQVRTDDGTILVEGGALAFAGILPPLVEIRARVSEKMGAAAP